MITKLFDPKGKLTLRFAKDDERIQEWLNATGTPLEDGLKVANLVNDPVFGEAWEFPCHLEYVELPEYI